MKTYTDENGYRVQIRENPSELELNDIDEIIVNDSGIICIDNHCGIKDVILYDGKKDVYLNIQLYNNLDKPVKLHLNNVSIKLRYKQVLGYEPIGFTTVKLEIKDNVDITIDSRSLYADIIHFE